MGAYIYKVTSNTVTLADGRKAHKAVYAYKPYRGWDNDAANAKMHFRSGCSRADHYAATSDKFSGLVTMDNGETFVETRNGSFLDDWYYGVVERNRRERA